MIKCINCSWEGEEAVGPLSHCPVCGDNTSATDKSKPVVKEDKKEVDMDLNGDGVFDAKDKTIAAKVLASGRKKRKKRK